METKTPIQEKRDFLKEISKEMKPLVKAGAYDTVNEAIINLVYMKDGHREFKTYEQWKSAGKQVKRGEKAFVVWGKPKSKQEDNKQENDEEKDPFYPLCFLFSNLQVS